MAEGSGTLVDQVKDFAMASMMLAHGHNAALAGTDATVCARRDHQIGSTLNLKGQTDSIETTYKEAFARKFSPAAQASVEGKTAVIFPWPIKGQAEAA